MICFLQLCEVIFTRLKNSPHHQRLFTLLGNIAMHYSSAVVSLMEHNVVSWTSQVLSQSDNVNNEETVRAAVRLLALCTQSNQQAQQAVATDRKREIELEIRCCFLVRTWTTSLSSRISDLRAILQESTFPIDRQCWSALRPYHSPSRSTYLPTKESRNCQNNRSTARLSRTILAE